MATSQWTDYPPSGEKHYVMERCPVAGPCGLGEFEVLMRAATAGSASEFDEKIVSIFMCSSRGRAFQFETRKAALLKEGAVERFSADLDLDPAASTSDDDNYYERAKTPQRPAAAVPDSCRKRPSSKLPSEHDSTSPESGQWNRRPSCDRGELAHGDSLLRSIAATVKFLQQKEPSHLRAA